MTNSRAGSCAEVSATHNINEKEPNCCGSFCDVFRNEFQLKNFGFNFCRRDAFEASQWRWPRPIFIVYRVILAVYTVAVVCNTAAISSTFLRYPYLTWYTYWAYIVLTLHCVYSAVVAIVACACCSSAQTPNDKLPVYLKIDWLLFVVASNAAPIITVAYFVGAYSTTDKNFLQDKTINEHLVNTVLIILEFCIAATPVRILHFVYPIVFGVAYAIFTVIYWAVNHNNVLYPIFCDWNQTGLSIAALVGYYFVVIPAVQLLFFAAYRLRLYVYRCIYRAPYVL